MRHIARCLVATAVIAAVFRPSNLQAQNAKPAMMVFREMAQSIADEASGGLGLDRTKTISLTVESGRLKTVLENAFLDAFRKNRYRIGIHDPSAAASVKVLSLEESLRYDEHRPGVFGRNMRLTVEVRLDGNEGDSRMLGRPARQVRDTVDQKEDLPAGEEAHGNGWELIAGPLIVVGAAMVLVYLFFTVRS